MSHETPLSSPKCTWNPSHSKRHTIAATIVASSALLCHTSSRTLTLLTIATGRWRYFGLGFALMTLIDGIAAYILISGRIRTLSTWWVELVIAPFGILSIPIIGWCVRCWPAAGTPQTGFPITTPAIDPLIEAH